MWRGEFNEDDCNYINQQKNVQLPSLSPEEDITYACHTNAERTAIHAMAFQNHIADFPSVESSEMPPSHTILVIEADITRAPSRKPKKNEKCQNNTFCPRVTKNDCEKI